METKNMIGGIVSLAVVVICVAAIMMPVLNEATTTHETFTNEGYFNMQKIDTDSSDVTLVWDYTDPYVITVNDEDLALPETVSFGAVSIIMADGWGLRYVPGTSVDLFGDANGVIASAAVSATTSMSVSLSAGTATFTVGDTSSTQTYTDAMHISDDSGAYVMKEASDASYLNGDSEIYCTGRTAIAGGQKNICVEGNIDDGVTATVIYPDGWTASDYVINATEATDYLDLYEFTSVSFTLTYGETTGSATYSQVAVPAEVTAELAQHLSDGENAILNAIPVILIAAIVIGAVAIFVTAKRD